MHVIIVIWTEGALQTASLMFYFPEAIAHSSKWREVLENTTVSGCVFAVIINESILTEALKPARSTQFFSSFLILPLHDMQHVKYLL